METKLKIAYLVIAYMDPKELRTLAMRLTQSADVYIHINASVDITPFRNVLKDVDGRICFSKERYQVVWGGYSILKAAFCMLEEAMEYCDYDRVVLLTGLDYPIKSDQRLEHYFLEHKNTEFVHADVVTGDMFDHLYYYDCRDNRFLHKIFSDLTKILKVFGLKGRKDTVVIDGKRCPLYGKAPKWALSGECAKYLLEFYRTHPAVNRYFRMMHAPDDFYVPTVLLNSGFRERIDTQTNIFKVVWLPEDKGAKVLEEDDMQLLLQCPQLYAKKFQSDRSSGLQCLLEDSFKNEAR